MNLPPIAPKAAATPPRVPDLSAADAEALKAAKAFEASFLAEMLKSSGLNAMPSSFGGGAGEEAFGSFLTQEYAQMMADRGGVGLAEQVFEALKQRTQR
jgi:Rod binding domain-containing protein